MVGTALCKALREACSPANITSFGPILIKNCFSDPSGMVALILEAVADESPLPAEPARIALLGSMLTTEATALSIWEDMLENGRIRMEFLIAE